MSKLSRIHLVVLVVFGLSILALTIAVVSAAPDRDGQVTVADVEFIGELEFPTGYQFAGTEVGGLSSITYDAHRGVYYSISDDQGQIDPVRFYTLAIDVSDGSLDPGDITLQDVTFLRDQKGELLQPASLDPEGMFLARPGFLFITSEGNSLVSPPIDPFVNRINLVGKENRALPVPEKFLPDGTGARGVRFNLAFESLTATPNRAYLYTGTEGALQQDGPAANIGQESLARLLEYDLSSKRPGREFVYVTEPVAETPDPPDAFRVNGLVELVALDNAGTFLAMERSFSVGKSNTVWLFEINTDGATDVSGDESLLSASFVPVSKRFLVNFADYGLVVDNLEGLAFGPPLDDGRLPLIVVSDNNFAANQVTQFVALAVELERAP